MHVNRSGIVLRKDITGMGCLGNLIWFFCGGILQGLSWTLAGLLWCITIIGIPFGLQCFKIAKLALMPFGATIVRNS